MFQRFVKLPEFKSVSQGTKQENNRKKTLISGKRGPSWTKLVPVIRSTAQNYENLGQDTKLNFEETQDSRASLDAKSSALR